MTQTKSNYKVGRLIIVDDEIELMTALCEILTRHGYETAGYTSGAEALAKLKEQDFDLLLTDLMMPEMGGIELLQAAREIDPDIVGIVMTGQGTVQTAVEAMKTGALDYIMKPFKLNGLLPVLSRAMEVRHLRTENMQLRETVAMHELGQALAFSSDLNQILNKVTDAVLQQCDADEASIMLPTSDGKELIIAVARGGHAEYIGKRISMGQGIAGWVAQNREPVTLNGEVHDERFASINPRSDISTAVSIPMIVGGSLIGVLNVNITRPHRPFTLGQVKTLIMLATIVSPILENARLYAEKRRAEDLYKTLAECSLAAVFIVQDGKFRFINAAVTSLGYSAEELIGRHSDTIIHPEDREMVKKRGGEMLRGEHTAPYEFRTVTKQGQIRWLMQIVSPILYEGRPAVLGNAIDVTERKKAEEALRESEEKYRALVETTDTGFVIIDGNGTVLDANENYIKMTGRKTLDEIRNRNVIEWTSQHDLERNAQAIKKCFDQGFIRDLEVNYVSKEGDNTPVEISATLVETNEGKRILSLCRDITGRKQAEEALRIQNQTFSEVLNGLDSLVYVIDMKTYEIVFINTYGQNIWGDIKGKICWQTIQEGQASPCEFCTNSQIIGPDGNPTKGVVWQFQNTVTKRWYDCRDKAIYWPDGRIVRMEIATDITENKQVEEALRSSEQQLSDIIEFLPDATLIIDKEGKVIAWNRAIEEMTGVKAEDMLGKGDYEYAIPFYGERRPILIDLALHPKPEMEISYNHIERKGDIIFGEAFAPGLAGCKTHLTATASVLRDAGGEIILAIECFRNNTERRRAQEDLRHAEERYRSIFDNAQEGIFQTTYEGQYLAANRALATILGYDSPEELMTTVTDITTQLYVDPEVRKALLKMIEEQGPVKGFETQFYRKDGSIIWVSVNQHAVRDAGGRVLHYEGFNDDITIKKGNVERMKKALWATVQAIAVTVETRDPYTAGHQRRVADLARAIAMEMNIPTDQIDGILMAAIIHDIGKISVPAEILSKPSKLTDLEFGIIKTHAQSGYDILKDIEFPWPIARMVLEHHERMDGSGYPRNLNGDDILMEARILAVSDVVEAMGSHRPYRPSRGIDAALEEIENKRGTHYDTGVVDACLRIFRGNGYHLEGTSF